MMLMTPLTALAPHRVAPGPLITSMRSMSSRQDVLHVPVDAGEQRRVDAAAVDQHQQLVGEALVGRCR